MKTTVTPIPPEARQANIGVGRRRGSPGSDGRPEHGGLAALPVICASISLMVGVTALVGWITDQPLLAQFFASRSAMQPMTAVCAILGAVGVVLAQRYPSRRRLAFIPALIVLAFALQTLAAFALGVDFGIDHLLFPNRVASQPIPYPHPGRMAAPTAAAYLLLCLALFARASRGRLAGLLLSVSATAVLALVTMALLGYLFMVSPVTGVFGFTQVSAPTALALGGLSAGILTLRPDEGWIRLLVGDTVGAVAARWLLPGVVIVPISVALLAQRGAQIELYPGDFRPVFTTAVTIFLLAALALWGARQLDRLASVRRTAEALRESEAALRAFFDTRGLYATIVEQEGQGFRYVAANSAITALYGRDDIVGMSVREVAPVSGPGASADLLTSLRSGLAPRVVEQSWETDGATRWFALTVSPIADHPQGRPRFATAAFEITERKRAEAHQQVLLEELNHRVKNTLAVVQSLAQQSFRGALTDPAAKQAFEARLAAVAAAHTLLVRQDWASASVRALASEVAGPGCGADPERIDLDGEDVALPPQAAVSVALALHELCTNAVKYGALSNDTGRVAISWSRDPFAADRLRITWRESGGPPVVAPVSRGFGSRLIERALAAELGRPVTMDFQESGLVCEMSVPLQIAAIAP